MKKIIFLGLIISLIIGSCTQEKRSPVEGSWKLISGKYTTQDTVINYPFSSNGNHMKIIDKKYFSTIWQDTSISKSNWLSAGFNGGTYTFEAGVYTETLTYFSTLANIGSKASFKAEIKSDTLVLTSIPEKASKGYSYVEKWKSLK